MAAALRTTAFRRVPVASAAAAAPRFLAAARRSFHATPRALVSVGDSLPDLEALHEDSPGNKVNLASEFAGVKHGVIVGVPAAFSGACSQKHIPSYIAHPRVKEIVDGGGKVVVISVNDAFVMKAWHDQLDPVKDSGIRFLADPSGAVTKALDLDFDLSAVFGGPRSKRYALVIEDGIVKSTHVEPDNTGTDVSMADKVLG